MKPVSEAVRDAITARDVYTLEILEAEYNEWNASNAQTFTDIQIRVALRGAINRLKEAYRVKLVALTVLFAVLMLGACTGNKPPQPPVPPTPPPSMALHVQGNRLVTATGEWAIRASLGPS